MRARWIAGMGLAAACFACGSACTQILGTYEQETVPAPGGPCNSEHPEDCPKGYGCQSNHCALQCQDPPNPSVSSCGAFRRCSSNLCTVPVGTPCEGKDDSRTCSPLNCETTDVNNQVVAPYCSDSYSSFVENDCPPGYQAIPQGECLKL